MLNVISLELNERSLSLEKPEKTCSKSNRQKRGLYIPVPCLDSNNKIYVMLLVIILNFLWTLKKKTGEESLAQVKCVIRQTTKVLN